MKFEFVEPQSALSMLKENDILTVERRFNINLPESLRSYYLLNNGGKIKECKFIIEDDNYEVVYWFPLISTERLSFEEIKNRYNILEELKGSLFPIADDGGEGLFYWDSNSGEIYYTPSNDGSPLEYLFSDIDEMFLAMNDSVNNGEYRRNKRMSKIDFKPLGSVVVLNGGSQRIMIIARGLNVENDGETYFFDYGGVPYPNGLTGDQMAYFNHNAIERVFFEGYRDDANDIMNERLNEYIVQHPDLKRKDFT